MNTRFTHVAGTVALACAFGLGIAGTAQAAHDPDGGQASSTDTCSAPCGPTGDAAGDQTYRRFGVPFLRPPDGGHSIQHGSRTWSQPGGPADPTETGSHGMTAGAYGVRPLGGSAHGGSDGDVVTPAGPAGRNTGSEPESVLPIDGIEWQMGGLTAP